jgi:organic radical activating enzyme
MKKANIVDVFSSFQGEGIYLGVKQIFVRFWGCNLRCGYCDTPESRDVRKKRTIGIEELMERVVQLEKSHGRHHSVSITGGEPLLQAGFLKTFLESLKRRNMGIYLETNGLLSGPLNKVVENVDVVAMDIKLRSSTGGRAHWSAHRNFLSICAKEEKDVFVKVIVTNVTNRSDFANAVALTALVDRRIPFVIQPATPVGKVEPGMMQVFYDDAFSKLNTVRVIPQMHRILGVM